jgi:hypothetical protein
LILCHDDGNQGLASRSSRQRQRAKGDVAIRAIRLIVCLQRILILPL